MTEETSTVDFYFDDSVYDTITNPFLYVGTNIRRCPSCNKCIENITPITLFHNHCCFNHEDRYDTMLLEEEILFVTYHLNHFNKKYILYHLKNINSIKHNYPDYIIEYLNEYILKINKQINNL